jgi:serine/threonine-protein kinase
MSDGTRPVAEQIPATIGRYQITGSLGFGAMGAVYKAFDPRIKRPLAIKTLRLDIPRSSPQYRSFIERFHHEAQISGTLSHPGIVTLFDLGEENGQPYFAMEFVDGRTVADVLAEGTRFKPEKVIGLVSQVASALDYAHSRGVVHRDVKPANLILYGDDKVKITDFGIAKLADTDITHSGALLGTPSYMSPEQAMGEKLDGRSDIFSLGVVAFEMLSGQQPFPGPNVTSILYKLVHVPPIEPANLEMNGLVPQKWHEVFSRVLAKKPEARYQTASAFVQDLEYCLGSWWSGLGGEAETLVVAPDPAQVPTVEIKVAEAPPVPAAAPAAPVAPAVAAPSAAAASPVVRDEEIETVQIPREAAPAAVPLLDEATPTDGTLALPPPPRIPDVPSTVILPPTGTSGSGRVGTQPRRAAPADVETVVIPPAATAGPGGVPTEAVRATLADVETVVIPPMPAAAPPPTAPRLPRGGARPEIPLPLVLGGALAALLAVGLGALALRSMRQPEPEAVPAPADPAPTAAAALQEPPPVAAPTSGTLRVVSEPPGARVLLDGRARGSAPLDLAELAFGKHEVRVEQQGYEPQRRSVELDAEAPSAELRITLVRRAAPAVGTADILSTPPGAWVKVDGKPVGVTPLQGFKLPAGTRQVEIALDGHETWSSSLDVVSGEAGKVEVRLRAIPKAPPTPEPVDVARVYPNEAGQVDTLARRVSGSSPSYPTSKAPRLKSGQRVSVLVRFVVSDTGDVSSIEVVESAGKTVDDVVLAAVKGWKYEPASKGGVRVKVETTFRQTFLGG